MLPEREKSSLLEKLTQTVLQRALRGVGQYIERYVKRLLRVAALVLAGIVILLVGIVFLAVGVVKWLSILVPSWLAWLIIGVILILLGIVLSLVALVSSRS